ncbi:MAG: MFS transporter [Pseudobutyrivibrio sp.]|nr:MFS transporter [Pseudobutyrivibrio sp.]
MGDRYFKDKNFRVNTLYVFAQGLYWMIVCCTSSMGSAYLSNRGYSTFSIGLLFALSSLFAIIIQQILSVQTDSATNFDVVDVLAILGGIITVFLVMALCTNSKGFVTTISFLACVTISTIIMPFLNALNFHIERYGIKVNFGVARAAGSSSFFVISLIAGFFMKTISEKAAPFLGFITSVLFTAVIVKIYFELSSIGIRIKKDYDPMDEKPSSNFEISAIKRYIENYKMFFIFLAGTVCFYFSHVIINNFFYQIAVNVGGDEATNGGLIALGAIVELPAMIFFDKIKERFGSKLLLSVSAVFFFLKILVTTIATSIPMLYFSMLFQALAFALFVPASVHFVDEIMSDKDAVKGQAFMTIAMTFSGLLGSVLGGFMFNFFGVTATLFFTTIVTLVGAIVAISGLVRINIQN